ncbi:MAG: 30S ribosomal protein S20 [Nitriliruptoraceae bacterium]
MANIKSQIKRNRQNETARERNRVVRSRLKTVVKQFRAAADSGDAEAAKAAFDVASRELDKAASKGILHRNTAGNRKSGMAKRLAAL